MHCLLDDVHSVRVKDIPPPPSQSTGAVVKARHAGPCLYAGVRW